MCSSCPAYCCGPLSLFERLKFFSLQRSITMNVKGGEREGPKQKVVVKRPAHTHTHAPSILYIFQLAFFMDRLRTREHVYDGMMWAPFFHLSYRKLSPPFRSCPYTQHSLICPCKWSVSCTSKQTYFASSQPLTHPCGRNCSEDLAERAGSPCLSSHVVMLLDQHNAPRDCEGREGYCGQGL